MAFRAPLHAVPRQSKDTLEDSAFKSAYREGKRAGEVEGLLKFAQGLEAFPAYTEDFDRQLLIDLLRTVADERLNGEVV